ncbi:uncharacterized protein LOC111266756 [Varroa jacobsoni]|uniref:uncharacterized protein LOC111266756 n=1 Tax=Varroa jacobsoni TaxID=62625 RepID=UPI000BF30B2B|nr:uncharacterized protein LOC111266756 [Varroa jacobsoni]
MFQIFGEIKARRTTHEVIRLLSAPEVQSKLGGYHTSKPIASSTIEVGISKSVNNDQSIPHYLKPQPLRKPGSRLGGIKRVAPSVKADPPKRARTPLASGSRCFAVMYAKPQTKKNKTWEDDGYLFLTKNNTLILRNMQGDEVTSGAFLAQNLTNGSIFSLGDKMIQIQDELNEMLEFKP